MIQIRTAATALLLTTLVGAALPATGTAQEPLIISAGAGLDMPSGEAADTHRRGFNAGVRLTFPLTPRIAVEGALGYWQLGRDDDVILVRRGEDPEIFRLGGGFFDGGHRAVLGGLAHVRLDLLASGAPLAPYLFAGGGLAHTAVTDIRTYFLGLSEIESGESEVALAADAGAGAEVRLSPGVSLFAQVGYLRLMDEAGTAMLPVQMGLAVRLGGQ